MSEGSWIIAALKLKSGDLEIKVYDEDGDLIAYDRR